MRQGRHQNERFRSAPINLIPGCVESPSLSRIHLNAMITRASADPPPVDRPPERVVLNRSGHGPKNAGRGRSAEAYQPPPGGFCIRSRPDSDETQERV